MEYFRNVYLPDFLARNVKKTIYFVNSISENVGNVELRSPINVYPKHLYKIENLRLSKTEHEKLDCFFLSMMGNLYSFRMKDYSDFTAKNQVLETEAREDYIQLIKTYGNDDHIIRKITKPKSENSKIYINNDIVQSYLIDEATGILKLEHSIYNSQILSVHFEFDVEVRFVDSSLSYELSEEGAILLKELELTEV